MALRGNVRRLVAVYRVYEHSMFLVRNSCEMGSREGERQPAEFSISSTLNVECDPLPHEAELGQSMGRKLGSEHDSADFQGRH